MAVTIEFQNILEMREFLSKNVCAKIEDTFCVVILNGTEKSKEWSSYCLSITGFVMFVKEYYGVNLQTIYNTNIMYDGHIMESISIDEDNRDLTLSVCEDEYGAVHTFSLNREFTGTLFLEFPG